MGTAKALLPLGGRPMVARVVESLVAAGGIGPIVVVTGLKALEVEQAVKPLGAICVQNADYAAGEMLSSVRCGVAAIADQVSGIMLVLGDQPVVRPQTLGQLRDLWSTSKAPIVIPTYAGRRGHPLILASALVSEIQALAPAQTLRDLVHRHLDAALQQPVDDPGVIVDVDTPDDYQRMQARWNRHTPPPGNEHETQR
jgi:CTP:molybdopterin cytidylyltransferase MocA